MSTFLSLTSIVIQNFGFGLAHAVPLIPPAPSVPSPATLSTVPTTTVRGGSPLWAQCGGIGYAGPTCVCFILPGAKSCANKDAAGYTGRCLLETPAGSLVPIGGQCGGQDYTGPTQCAEGLTCGYASPWFIQSLSLSPKEVKPQEGSSHFSTAPRMNGACSSLPALALFLLAQIIPAIPNGIERNFGLFFS
ncbi:hypothetical protein BKA70DRAFT_1225164 [Coprinopsis sp. MPI-PUGE-AT-0042]|nr:hypothetical protein BKA70DRAFT_1225164 [Coprinopsis sp. MPI-PUGE-AT-0042]